MSDNNLDYAAKVRYQELCSEADKARLARKGVAK